MDLFESNSSDEDEEEMDGDEGTNKNPKGLLVSSNGEVVRNAGELCCADEAKGEIDCEGLTVLNKQAACCSDEERAALHMWQLPAISWLLKVHMGHDQVQELAACDSSSEDFVKSSNSNLWAANALVAPPPPTAMISS